MIFLAGATAGLPMVRSPYFGIASAIFYFEAVILDFPYFNGKETSHGSRFSRCDRSSDHPLVSKDHQRAAAMFRLNVPPFYTNEVSSGGERWIVAIGSPSLRHRWQPREKLFVGKSIGIAAIVEAQQFSFGEISKVV